MHKKHFLEKTLPIFWAGFVGRKRSSAQTLIVIKLKQLEASI
jgi:hypothetical protein